MRKTKVCAISMTEGQKGRLDRLSKEMGITRSEIVNYAMILLDNSYEVRNKVKLLSEILPAFLTISEITKLPENQRRAERLATINLISNDVIKSVDNFTWMMANTTPAEELERIIQIVQTKWVED